MALTWTAKAPGAVYRYSWTPALADGDGLAGYTVSASGATIDSEALDGDAVVLFVSGGTAATTATFTFTGLAAGNYVIAEELPTGWSQTLPTANGRQQTQLAAGETKSGLDFGNFQAMTIRGTVFEDLNQNSQRDAGEAALSGWLIFLDSNNNDRWDSGELVTRTDAAGNYSFSGLGVGPIASSWGQLHHVVIVGISGWTGNRDWGITSVSGATFTNLNFWWRR